MSQTQLVLVIGPLAGGKSTTARALTEALRARERSVALVELDQIADMARPTLPDWSDAHAIFAMVTGRWLQAGLDVVVAEGPGSLDEVDLVHRSIPDGTPVITVAAEAPFSTAWERVQEDPTRGLSRDPDFLSRMHARWDDERALVPIDLRFDTSRASVEESVAEILRLL
jgi:energy-coupling factor transporter ATP-binding protein EcfA2